MNFKELKGTNEDCTKKNQTDQHNAHLVSGDSVKCIIIVCQSVMLPDIISKNSTPSKLVAGVQCMADLTLPMVIVRDEARSTRALVRNASPLLTR